MVDDADQATRTGILVVAHGDLARHLIGAAEEILGPQRGITGLRIDPASGEPRKQLLDAVGDLDEGAGVLALTDLFGGTPSNVALAACPEKDMEVVTGVNLPMLIRALTRRGERSVGDLAEEVSDYGRRQIMLPNSLLSAGEVNG